MVVGTPCRPNSFDQFWEWGYRYIPSQKKILFVGLAAVCWAVWNTRNKTHFEKRNLKSPTEVVCSIASFLMYWAGLQKEEEKASLEMGAMAMKEAALYFHPQGARADDIGSILLQ
ncbi:unnamed protein product [Urochloa humidicola]